LYVPWDCNRVESLTRSSCPPWYGIITQSRELQFHPKQTSWLIHIAAIFHFLWIQNEVQSRCLCYVTLEISIHDIQNAENFTTRTVSEVYRQSIDGTNLVMSKSVKKLVEETKEQGYTELELCDKSLSSIADIPGLSK